MLCTPDLLFWNMIGFILKSQWNKKSRGKLNKIDDLSTHFWIFENITSFQTGHEGIHGHPSYKRTLADCFKSQVLVSCVMFLDFCKAFDTVSPRTLLGKMSSPHLDKHTMSWLRTQAQNVTVNGLTTGLRSVTSWFCQPWPCALQNVHKWLGCSTRRDTKQICQKHYTRRSFQALWRKGGSAEGPWWMRVGQSSTIWSSTKGFCIWIGVILNVQTD